MFYAYSSKPNEVKSTIENTVKNLKNVGVNIKPWTAMDVNGAFIPEQVRNEIDVSTNLVADISVLNFNVVYEIGFAIGQSKSVLLTKNTSIPEIKPTIKEVGIFDTIGYSTYSISNELYDIIKDTKKNTLYNGDIELNNKAPVYILETKDKTDFSTRLTSRIKKARLFYRSFDPNEMPRLSAHDAIKQTAQSRGIVVHLLAGNSNIQNVHNTRGAFLAGLAHGMNKKVLIIQYGNDPIPIDYRDNVKVYNTFEEIDDFVAEFASEIVATYQEERKLFDKSTLSYLQKIELGSSAAENEIKDLKYYYLKTDQFQKAFRGEAQLVVGRKGSGKSAIFLQIRDKERSKKTNVVLDLKPEGYILIKFKEQILTHLERGTFEHTITAFWEYILLLEITLRILENDSSRRMTRNELYDPYEKLHDYYYNKSKVFHKGDFSERLSSIIERVTIEYNSHHHGKKNVRLSQPEITGLLHKNDITNLIELLKDYLKYKDKVIILFDNIDKGWPSSGLDTNDITIIRTLMNAARNIQRSFDKQNIAVTPILFLRNDVYELLVRATSDRQKESKIVLDWVDADLLREVIKLRISSNLDESEDLSFDEYWRKICISHIQGEDTSQFLIDRSLMRPRFLINLINQCKSFAINFKHSIIEEEDIMKGFNAFSTDLLTDISYELQDILKSSTDILYQFIGSKKLIPKQELHDLIFTFHDVDSEEKSTKIIDLLLWYGFLGISIKSDDPKFIYDFNYNSQIMKGLIKKNESDIAYAIHPGFWPALLIE